MKPCLVLAIVCLLAAAPATCAADAAQGKPAAKVEIMSREQEKSLSRRSLEMWGSNNTDKPEDVFAKNYVNHQESDAKGGVKSLDLAGWKEVVAENHRAFSDFTVRILLQVAEGELVATRWQFAATQTGVYLGHPPTGKHATWTGIQIDRFAGGKIVESWVDWDKYRLFETLGFVK
jgi:predicted ester cyclase